MSPSSRRRFLGVAAATGAAGVLGTRDAYAVAPRARTVPAERLPGTIETVAELSGPIVTGITVSRTGRIFVTFPRWDDPVRYSVAELRPDGSTHAYPNAAIHDQRRPLAERLVSVQSAVVDPLDRLWLVDTGSLNFGPVTTGGPKLVGVNLRNGKVFASIVLPPQVALPTTYINDVRFDLRRGDGGLAFLTDSSGAGPNGIVVVELGSGRSWRHLTDHPSTKAEPGFLPLVEARPVLQRKPGQRPRNLSIGSDGIAISADGERLFYTPLASRRLYSVSIDALADSASSDAAVASTVVDHGDKGSGSDGLESDAAGGIYLTAYEHNAVLRRTPSGTITTVVSDPRLLWPDTLSLAADGCLYGTASQLHRGPGYNHGVDLRRNPYLVFRTRVGQRPVLLA